MEADETARNFRQLRPPGGQLDSLFSAARWRELGDYLRLTPRQLAVARLVCADCRISDMSRELGLSPNTVGSHLKALYARLGAQSRVGVVVRLVLAGRVLDGRMPGKPGGGRVATKPATRRCAGGTHEIK